ncbi:hypothetical protein AK830_g1758 [Neonectria ditissima]|uniref:NACHT-NTPase and P-loop NTPases N-terminal domain-containing protein n=1 Tax=Neonectria ditissima TaxID=78410 RepID=A0A0P7BWE8_9HYPO|nr:hypothetical protein AK830_g1758 [Neonectria ditissima]
MAELLGVVSSAITIVETAGKLVSSAITLKRLWDEVQDVPDSIRRQMLQLEMLVPVLEGMEDEFQQTRNMLRNDRAAIRSLEYCRKAMEELEGLTQDMQLQITTARKGKRTLAKFKVTLKKGVVQQCQERLGSTLQLLALSQQTYLIALTRVQPSIIMSEFQALQAQSREAEAPQVGVVEEETEEGTALGPSLESKDCDKDKSNFTSRTSQNRPPWSNVRRIPWQKFSLLPKFSYQATEVSAGHSLTVTSQVHQARIQLPWWLAQKAWDFQAYRAYDGWQIQLTPWCIRPRGSEVFRYAFRGSTDELLAAFDRKEASLYDCDPYGWTLFDYAFGALSTGPFEQLINMGLRTWHPFRAFGVWGYNPPKSRKHHKNILDVVWFLIAHGLFEDHVDDLMHSESLSPLILRALWSIPGLPDPVHQSSVPNSGQAVPASWFKIERWNDIEPSVLLDFLTRNNSTSPAFFRAQLPRHSCCRVRRVVQMWLEDLMEAGVDLEVYGQLEEIALKDQTYLGTDFILGLSYIAGPYVVSFQYGPRPEDWKIGYDPCVEEYAGTFWKALVIERRTREMMPRQMPGSWENDTDDDDDDDDDDGDDEDDCDWYYGDGVFHYFEGEGEESDAD